MSRPLARHADLVLGVAATPVAAAGLYLAGLAVAARRPSTPPPAPEGPTRFSIVVPAHDEEGGIAATVKSLSALDYPAERFRVVVVADNCTDATAAEAAGAGARVIVRDDPSRRGKGYALELAFDELVHDGWTDALVVVDADTSVSPGLLGAFAARIAQGASAMQADYRVANAEHTWRTRLMRIAFAAFHEVRSLGRERLGLSCGLRGNGMCFTRTTVLAVPHRAYSLVEDLEYGLRLGRAGIRVVYVHEAAVESEMPADGAAARSQRRRWEEGRARFRRTHGPGLVVDAVRHRDPVLADLAADVLVPPLGQLVAAAAAGVVIGSAIAGRRSLTARVCAVGLVGTAAHVGVAWRVSGTGVQGLVDLARAPGYVAWKLLARRRRRDRDDTWVRTARGRR